MLWGGTQVEHQPDNSEKKQNAQLLNFENTGERISSEISFQSNTFGSSPRYWHCSGLSVGAFSWRAAHCEPSGLDPLWLSLLVEISRPTGHRGWSRAPVAPQSPSCHLGVSDRLHSGSFEVFALSPTLAPPVHSVCCALEGGSVFSICCQLLACEFQQLRVQQRVL